MTRTILSQIGAAKRAIFWRRSGVQGTGADTKISTDFNAWNAADAMLEKAQTLRDQGLAIRSAVVTVRSSIIRRECNDRLNKVWRDLFVRLGSPEALANFDRFGHRA